jgi:CHAT domain-containing protein
VTLSSCESGVGRAMRGEGLLALTRGFFYAGAGNVLSSLWKVPDGSTRELMVDFYGNVLRGMSLMRSVRSAKLSLIASPFTAFPREWAGFVLLGMRQEIN